MVFHQFSNTRGSQTDTLVCGEVQWIHMTFQSPEHSYHGLKRMLIEFRKWGIYSTNSGYRTRLFPTRRRLSVLCSPCGVAMIAPSTSVTEHLCSRQGQRVMC